MIRRGIVNSICLAVLATSPLLFACFTSRSPGTVTVVTSTSSNCTSCQLSNLTIDNSAATSINFPPTTVVEQSINFITKCSQLAISCNNGVNTFGAVEFIFNRSPNGQASLPNDCSITQPNQCIEILQCDNLGRWTANVQGSTVVVKTVFCQCINGCVPIG